MLFTILLVLVVCVEKSFSARILGVVPTPSYSHQVVFQPLWKELSLRGHQVTVLTANPIKDYSLTNLTEIDFNFMYRYKELDRELFVGPFKFLENLKKFFTIIVDSELSHPEVQALIQNEKEYFDVLLVEGLEMTMSYFSERFKCPYIHIYSLEPWARDFRALGNPTHPGLYPDFVLPYTRNLNFWQRLESFVFAIYAELYQIWIHYPVMEELAKKHFKINKFVSVQELKRKVSMVFINTDSVLHEVRPLLPNIVQIGGGTHLKPSKPLPVDLQKQLDSAINGFLYVSFGNNVKSKDLAPEARQKLIDVFRQLPYLVLWKFELDNLPGRPSNVIISKWLPQQDVLRHPNIRLFITQGGLQSMEEAIYSTVPMIGIPFIADQYKNVVNMQHRGLGIGLDMRTLDKVVFKNTIFEVINNPKYKNAIIKLAQLGRDQPMTGLEKAVWWTEYVIRNKGADHLKSPFLDMPWYQYFLLDIAAFLITALIVFIVILKKAVCFSVSMTKNCLCSNQKLKTS